MTLMDKVYPIIDAKTGRMLWETRKKKGITQAEVAKSLGVTQSNVSKMENGSQIHVSVTALSKAYRTLPERLLGVK